MKTGLSIHSSIHLLSLHGQIKYAFSMTYTYKAERVSFQNIQSRMKTTLCIWILESGLSSSFIFPDHEYDYQDLKKKILSS